MDAMLERATTAMRLSWDEDAGTASRAVLRAALSDLDTNTGWCRWGHGTWVVIAYPAFPEGRRNEVELFVDGVLEGLSADAAEARGLMLVAAARRSRQLTSSGVEVA